MPPSKPIRVGFIGLSTSGWAAGALAPSLISLKNDYDLVALSTSSEASAAVSAAKYSADVGHPITAYSGDTSKIANDPNVDLVVVSVKTPMHKQLLTPVIEAKKDFFIEWPAGRNLQETQEFAELARKNGVRSIVGLQGRSSRVVAKLKEIIGSGKIGAVHSTSIIATLPQEGEFWPPLVHEGMAYSIVESNGATLLSIPIGHFLDSFTQVLGDFASVNATSTLFHKTAIIIDIKTRQPTGKTLPVTHPDHISISGVLKSGAFASLFWRSGYKTTPGRRRFLWEIDGDEGSIRVESDHMLGPMMSMFDPDIYVNGEKVEYVEKGAVGGSLHNVTEAWKAFVSGEQGKYPTIDDAVKNHKLLAGIRKSLDEARVVRLE
ncbi:hypothetical protein NLJ89_g6950 [Agrocybe chaxingu]|uniref:Gfo/Idh/MocA-like oxidoreductase N-terminal domain-containing protein n=1 Tax=Agrocybe chaxingu TaxID=84603 RepID=A0A9W8MU58_9AGAR|nr:hypothetical protein NLJ89_g6950 [Agrocybe chaxingu]